MTQLETLPRNDPAVQQFALAVLKECGDNALIACANGASTPSYTT